MEKNTFTQKLHKVCSNDELRPIAMCVHFKNGFAYAYDGYIAIKQSLEYHTILGKEHLEGKSLHRDSYEAVMKFEIAECDDNGISCKSTDGQVAYYEFFDRKGEMPDFDKVFRPTGMKSIEFIGLNPKYLIRLHEGMHSPTNQMRLEFQGVDKAVLVSCPDIPDQEGIIMPVSLNGTLDFGKNE